MSRTTNTTKRRTVNRIVDGQRQESDPTFNGERYGNRRKDVKKIKRAVHKAMRGQQKDDDRKEIKDGL
jgi:hypothetical protein